MEVPCPCSPDRLLWSIKPLNVSAWIHSNSWVGIKKKKICCHVPLGCSFTSQDHLSYSNTFNMCFRVRHKPKVVHWLCDCKGTFLFPGSDIYTLGDIWLMHMVRYQHALIKCIQKRVFNCYCIRKKLSLFFWNTLALFGFKNYLLGRL